MSAPLVSIIIPVHNSAAHLAETVQSALSQTWQNIEVILVDDGSTDHSPEIARRFTSGIVKVFSQENKGASAARNMGLKEAKGDYIQFLDADDLLSPDKIDAQVKCLNGSVTDIAISRTIHFNDGECHIKGTSDNDWFYTDHEDPVSFLTKLYAGEDVMPGYGGMITIHSWLTPRNLIDKAGPWNENLSVDDDGEFFCRVVLASDSIKFSEKAFNYYRKFDTPKSLSGQKNLKGMKSAVMANDLKLDYLKARTENAVVNRIFAKHYWWAGVLAYPEFKSLSKYCIQKAKELGYGGDKYVGGPTGHFLAVFLGWKTARLISYYQQMLKRAWA